MESEQPQYPEQASPPRAYVNFGLGQGTALELAVTLGYKEGNAAPTVLAPIVMSWEFVPVLIRLLQDQLDSYQEKMGPVRDVMESAEIDES